MNSISLRISVVFLLFVFFSCSKENDTHQTQNFSEKSSEADSESDDEDNFIVLGEQLPNPYTVSAMNAAYNELVAEGAIEPGSLEIEETHQYVRFEPSNDEEFDVLAADDELALYDHPLDYEIVEDGDVYHDPELSEEGYTYYYAVVPLDYELPDGIATTVLATIMLDEDGEDDTYYQVEEKSFELLGIWSEEEFGEEEGEENGKTMGSKYNPRGQIRFNDADLGTTTGLHGVKIYVRRWFKTAYTLTNANGDFWVSKRYRGKVRYKIKWERSRFTIRQGVWLQAYTKGPKTKSAWNTIIYSTLDQRRKLYACIHVAAYQYYYGDRHGMQRPPGETWNKLKIGAYLNGSTNDHAYWRTFISWPRIRIKDASRTASQIYATTIHELTHAVHWSLPGNFNQVEDLLVESFAAGIDWYFTFHRYGDGSNAEWANGMQWKLLSHSSITSSGEGYSPLIVDLIDDDNQIGGWGTTADPNTPSCSQGTRVMSSRGMACRIATAPAGTTPFTWSGNYYHTPLPGGGCPAGTVYDGANCLIGTIPQGNVFYIDGQNFFIGCDGTADYPNDYVSGYAPYQIQNALHNVKNRWELRNNLRNQYWNAGEGMELDTLFGDYNGINP